MEKEGKIRKYKDDDFKINCIYEKDGKTLNKIIEEAFRDFYYLRVKA